MDHLAPRLCLGPRDEGLGFHLAVAGKVQCLRTGQVHDFRHYFPCFRRDRCGRCEEWDRDSHSIKIHYRCSKCDSPPGHSKWPVIRPPKDKDQYHSKDSRPHKPTSTITATKFATVTTTATVTVTGTKTESTKTTTTTTDTKTATTKTTTTTTKVGTQQPRLNTSTITTDITTTATNATTTTTESTAIVTITTTNTVTTGITVTITTTSTTTSEAPPTQTCNLATAFGYQSPERSTTLNNLGHPAATAGAGTNAPPSPKSKLESPAPSTSA
ncbi:hypothetical protein QBC40DRAFT_331143 [Triangularia verruculosa]|uniref:Uncharacterized protein n=1 Tax=Triangularia verruculosa TaxID=2587418 RepID=A0AAN6XDG1_9PEZI|nr:hypothetical protein QBC40DRAFT_331143 [Triangularia verruculosa]